jgi:alpha-beta hydrolase superfamily lysophospholipase
MPEITEAYFKSHDQHRLYYKSIKPKKPRATLIFIHGYNEHSGRYEPVIKYFQNHYNVYLYDHRGHGRSDGVRFFAKSFDDFILDLDAFISLVTSLEDNQEIFLVGHSMGGQILLNYLAKNNPATVTGFITSGANITLKTKINIFKRYLTYSLAEHLPQMKVPHGLNTKWLSRDKKIVRAYNKDPLIGSSITARLATELLHNQKTILKYAPHITLPGLMLHGGDDHICDKKGSKCFFEKLNSKDKELKIYPGFYHEIFNEIDREIVFADMASWLKEHITNS